jgi:hypothetical protein
MVRSPIHETDAPQLRTPVQRHAYSMPVVREIPPAIRLNVFTADW